MVRINADPARDPGRRVARILLMSLLAAPVLYGAGAWVERHADGDGVLGFVAFILCFVLPLAAFAMPISAVALLALMAAKRWYSRMAVVFAAAIGLSVGLFAAGEWTRGLYGLDPPYSLFFLGGAMQLVALAVPIATSVWWAAGVVAARRERHDG